MKTSRFLFVLLCAWLLALQAPAAPPARPRLVVLLVIDGLPQRQVEAVRGQLAPDGFARFLERGASFTQAHFGHAFTVTASGHATIATGASPSRSGIIGNEWLDPATLQPVYCTGDPDARYIGQVTQPGDGTSPRNLQVETVGDVLRRVDPRSKVIAVSGKDRGAILTAGHAGTAYMYMDDTGQFASSTYYLQQHPAWVERFNAARPADRFFHAQWRALSAGKAQVAGLPRDLPVLPITMGSDDAAPGPRFYASLLRSPFADALTLDFARAAIGGEQLGADDAPDLLAISLSGHDYVNHAWSAESRLSQDHLLHLDRMLRAFFADLDRSVGRGQYVAVLTADHGFMPAPEVSRARGEDAGRLAGRALVDAVNATLARRFQAPTLVALSASGLLLDRAQLAARGLDPATVAAAARAALLAQPGIAAAYTRQELAGGGDEGAPFFRAMRRSWNPERSGDVQFVLRPHWMFGNAGATHGSPYDVDTHVPLLLWGPAWIAPGARDVAVDMTDLAPTLAALLRIPAPAASEGRPLPLLR